MRLVQVDRPVVAPQQRALFRLVAVVSGDYNGPVLFTKVAPDVVAGTVDSVFEHLIGANYEGAFLSGAFDESGLAE